MLKIIPIKTQLIAFGNDPIDSIINSISEDIIDDKDVVVVSSKPLLIGYGFIINRSEIKPSDYALKLSEMYKLDPALAELVYEYSDYIYGGVKKTLLTEVNDTIIPNAGIDRKNVPMNHYALPFSTLKGKAREIYSKIREKFNVRVGVIISDSTVYPLRLGTRSIAIYTYGFYPLIDFRGKKDLYNKEIQYTVMAYADEIASAAHLTLGEGDEKVPAAIVKGLDIKLVEKETTNMLLIEKEKCLFNKIYSSLNL